MKIEIRQVGETELSHLGAKGTFVIDFGGRIPSVTRTFQIPNNDLLSPFAEREEVAKSIFLGKIDTLLKSFSAKFKELDF